MKFNLCVTENILGNKLLIAEKVLSNTILITEHFLGNNFFWPVTRQDFQKEAGCHVRLPGSWPKNLLPRKCLVINLCCWELSHQQINLLTRKFSATSCLLKLNLLPRKCLVIHLCCRELSLKKKLIDKKVLGNKLLIVEKVLGNIILLPSIFWVTSSGNSYSYSRVDDTRKH